VLTSVALAAVLALPAPTEPLAAGQVVKRAIARGERHSFRVTAAAGEVVQARLSSFGVSPDLIVSAAGSREAKAEASSGYPAVTLAWRLDAAGDVGIDVACPGGRRGRYVLEVESRPPTPADLLRLEAQAAMQAGQASRSAGRAQAGEAAVRFRRAADLGAEIQDVGMQFEALTALGQAQRRADDARGSDETYTRLRDVVRGRSPFEGEVLYRRAVLHLGQGEFEPALPLLHEALRLARAARIRLLEAYAFDGLGEFYNDVGDDRKGLAYRRQSLEMVSREGRLSDEAALLQKIGISLMHHGDLHQSPAYYQEAIAHHGRALDLFAALDNGNGQGTTLHHLGLLERKQGRPAAALDHFQRALALKKPGSGRASIAQTLMGICATYETLGDLDRALEYAGQAQALLRESPSLLAIHWKAPATIARLQRDRGDLEAARRAIESAASRVEAAGMPLASDGLRSAWAAITDEVYDLYVDILMRLHAGDPAGGFDRAALEASERGRARGLRELLREARVSLTVPLGVDARLLEDERRLREGLSAVAEKQREGSEDPAVARELRALTTEHDALRARIRGQDPRYAALTQAAPVSASRLQELVEPGTALLEYDLGRPRSYLWVVTSEGLASYTLPGEDVIGTLARQLHERLSARNAARKGTAAQRQRAVARADAEVARTAEQLGRLLLGPVEGLGRYRRLVVVPDGVLHYVPFAALPAEGGGEPLVTRYEVLHLPSAAVAGALRAATPPGRAPRPAAVFADPVFRASDPRVRTPPPKVAAAAAPPSPRKQRAMDVSRLPRLRYTRTLAEEVTRGAEEALVAVDFAASRENVTQAGLDQFRMVFFATHGLLDSEYPELTGVALSMVDEEGRPRDGLLRLQDVYHLKLNADLVVLGACESGLGREMRGEGLVSLSRGFFYAGASRVMASLWKVDEQATVELIRDVYRAVEKDGLSYPAALRRAQLRLRQDPRFASPYYWAAFFLQGGS
jgi:CHAT domain-containing protein/tetratricopeptide (TPR) repeat protein